LEDLPQSHDGKVQSEINGLASEWLSDFDPRRIKKGIRNGKAWALGYREVGTKMREFTFDFS